jgi:hypothetical protein
MAQQKIASPGGTVLRQQQVQHIKDILKEE